MTKCQQSIRLTYFAISLPQLKILGGQSPGNWLSNMEKEMVHFFVIIFLVLFRLNFCKF